MFLLLTLSKYIPAGVKEHYFYVAEYLSEAQSGPLQTSKMDSLQQQLTAKCHNLLVQNSPSYMFAGFLATPLIFFLH